MLLNERKLKILEAIISDYIRTAEPIGSRTIAKKYDLGISSATIRNEMSDLEDMGFIIQPHASSGRVPSDKGYRLYVDRFKDYRELTNDETIFIKNVIHNNINHIDYMMRETAKAISLLTNYTAVITEPQFTKTRVKRLQLMPLDEKSIIMVLVTDNKTIKNHVIETHHPVDEESISKLTLALNESLSGRSVEEIDLELVSVLSEDFNVDLELLRNILGSILLAIKSEDDIQIYTSGVNNILSYPEFNDLEKAKSLFQTLEEKDMLITLLDNDGSEEVQIRIGSENNMEQLKDCSIIKSVYSMGGQNKGSIGIIGPKRMDYVQVASILSGISKNINAILKALTGG